MRYCYLSSLLTLALLSLILVDELLATFWALVFETIMLLAFGISWLVKGETLFADKPNEERFNLTIDHKSAELQ